MRERLMLGGAGGGDGHPGLAKRAQAGEGPEGHASVGVPGADRIEDSEPRLLGEVVARSARQVQRPGDAAGHRLVAGEQLRHRGAVAALGGANQPLLGERRQIRRIAALKGGHAWRP
jgi:hypothetical protein